MNGYICLLLLVAVASANAKPQSWGYTVHDDSVKPASWQDGSVSYVSGAPAGYWPSYYSSPSVYQPADWSKNWQFQKVQSAPVIARSDASAWNYAPASWSGASYAVPQQWSAGFYSAGLPAQVEKQVVAKKVVAAPQVSPVKVDQVQPVADPTPKLITYSTEISHDVPAKREEIAGSVVPVTRTIAAPQVAPKVVAAPVQYSAWSGDVVKPVADVKPASWASEVKPASWVSEVKPGSWSSEVKPGSWSSEVKPAGWTSEIKPAQWASWAEPKPATYAAWTPEVKPASWAAWSEPKPWASYPPPTVQPAFYGQSWGQPIVSTNAHHAISAPWSSGWSSAQPVSWTEPIQKRSERKPF